MNIPISITTLFIALMLLHSYWQKREIHAAIGLPINKFDLRLAGIMFIVSLLSWLWLLIK